MNLGTRFLGRCTELASMDEYPGSTKGRAAAGALVMTARLSICGRVVQRSRARGS